MEHFTSRSLSVEPKFQTVTAHGWQPTRPVQPMMFQCDGELVHAHICRRRNRSRRGSRKSALTPAALVSQDLNCKPGNEPARPRSSAAVGRFLSSLKLYFFQAGYERILPLYVHALACIWVGAGGKRGSVHIGPTAIQWWDDQLACCDDERQAKPTSEAGRFPRSPGIY